MSRLDVFKPTLGAEELAAIASTFESGWIGKGAKVTEFEAAWAAHIGVDPAHVVSVNCATEGLFQVCELVNPWPEAEIIIPSIHFIGADNAIEVTEGRAVYCDVDPHTLNPRLEHIQAAYNQHETRALILLHYGGVAQELDTIRQWCDEKGIFMIEDAACAQATQYKGKTAGTWGHFGVWSFDAMKVITCGDGGMIYCENLDEANDLRHSIYLGLNEQSGLLSDKDRWWEYTTVNDPGRRAIMNDIAASIGLEQLKKLPAFVERRKVLVNHYDYQLAGRVRVPSDNDLYPQTPYYFYWIQTSSRDELAKYLREHGIYTTFRYYPLHRVFKTGQHLPGADYAADHTLLLPLHQGLSDDDVMFVCEKVKEFFA